MEESSDERRLDFFEQFFWRLSRAREGCNKPDFGFLVISISPTQAHISHSMQR